MKMPSEALFKAHPYICAQTVISTAAKGKDLHFTEREIANFKRLLFRFLENVDPETAATIRSHEA